MVSYCRTNVLPYVMTESMELPYISLFTGAGGLDLGLDRAGLTMRVAVEVDKWSQATLKVNRARFRSPDFAILGDITRIPPEDVVRASGLARGEAFLVAGGPPCQSFSTAGRRGSVADPRGTLFANFGAVVAAASPRFFVFENVRGMLSAAIRHRPLSRRGPTSPRLQPEEQQGTAFQAIRNVLEGDLGYQLVYGLVDAADYGVPQNRHRVIILGSRDHEFADLRLSDIMPPTHPGPGKWVNLGEALDKLDDPKPEYLPYSLERAKIMRLIPPGRNWRWLRDNPAYGRDFTERVMGGAWAAGGGKVGFFRRLSWEKPSPTLPTSPIQKSTSLCHPVENRPLSVKEYAAIQQFPDRYMFAGGTAQKYRQIGNAVPVGLGTSIGRALADLTRRAEVSKVLVSA